ncbi:monocarboxylate transporter 5-like isoform X3 [Dermacentor variabilis]|uniref:monocarboxylate transporter 5-like isoform X3 n=1 Tax=Dermacentor variabilis TaxID=34621 RepID=UPI003F5C1C90
METAKLHIVVSKAPAGTAAMGLSRKPAVRARQIHGLVVVAAVFWINMFVLGLLRASGVLYVAMVRTYQCSHEQASWPFSLAGATLCMTGPIAGALSRFLSVRAIVTTGIVTTGLAVSCCFFAENIVVVVVLVGIFYGAGTGMVCNLTPLLLTEHFEKHRAIACGVAYSGSTIGSFFWPPLLEYLINEFGLRGALLIYGSTILHGVMGSILLTPLYQAPRKESEADNVKPDGEDEKMLEPLREKCQSLDFHPFQNGHTNTHGGNIGRRHSSRMSVRSALGDGDSACAVSVSGLCMVVSDGEQWRSRDEHLDRRCSPATSLKKLNEPGPLAPLWEAAPDATLNSPHNGKQPPKASLADDGGTTSSLCGNIIRVVLNDLKLLGNRYFILVTTSAVGFFFVFSTFIIIIPDYATDKGLSISDGVFLLSVYGISDLFSKPIPGFLAYKNIMDNKGIFISGGIITGSTMIIMPFMDSYWFFVVVTLLFGLVTGGLIFMTPVLLTEFLGPQLAVMAFGLCNLFIGITCLLRPFIIGYFKDNWHSYNGLFYTMAVACILSSLSWYVGPLVDKVWTFVSRPSKPTRPQEV